MSFNRQSPLVRAKLGNRFVTIFIVLLLIIDISLTVSKIIPLKYAIYIAAMVEPIILILALINTRKIIKRYRYFKGKGMVGLDALQKALEVAVPPVVARLALMEIRLYHSLYKSFKRARELPQDGIYLNKTENYNFFAKVFLLLIALEGLAVAFLVPHKWWKLRLVHTILSVYAFIFMFSDYRVNKLYANELSEEKLRLKMGLKCQGEISWANITSIGKCSKDIAEFALVPIKDKEEQGILYFSAGESCNLKVKLNTPCTFRGYFKDFKNINIIYLALEKPDQFIEEVEKKLSE